MLNSKHVEAVSDTEPTLWPGLHSMQRALLKTGTVKRVKGSRHLLALHEGTPISLAPRRVLRVRLTLTVADPHIAGARGCISSDKVALINWIVMVATIVPCAHASNLYAQRPDVIAPLRSELAPSDAIKHIEKSRAQFFGHLDTIEEKWSVPNALEAMPIGIFPNQLAFLSCAICNAVLQDPLALCANRHDQPVCE